MYVYAIYEAETQISSKTEKIEIYLPLLNERAKNRLYRIIRITKRREIFIIVAVAAGIQVCGQVKFCQTLNINHNNSVLCIEVIFFSLPSFITLLKACAYSYFGLLWRQQLVYNTINTNRNDQFDELTAWFNLSSERRRMKQKNTLSLPLWKFSTHSNRLIIIDTRSQWNIDTYFFSNYFSAVHMAFKCSFQSPSSIYCWETFRLNGFNWTVQLSSEPLFFFEIAIDLLKCTTFDKKNI